MRFLHTGDCSSAEITTAATFALVNVDSTEMLASVNTVSLSVGVTDLTFSDAIPIRVSGDVTGAITQFSQNSAPSQLTAGGIFAVSLTGLTLAVAVILLLCLVYARVHASRRDENTEIVTAEESMNYPIDATYVIPEWGDFGRLHSAVDSHCCNSALCKMCRPREGGDKMMEVRRLGLYHQSKLCVCLLTHDKVDDDGESPPHLAARGDLSNMVINVAAMEDVLLDPSEQGDEKVSFIRHSKKMRPLSAEPRKTVNKSVTL